MKKFWKTKEFQELEKEWELKLKRAGFVDAEKNVRGERTLKQRASNSYRSEEKTRRENKQRYFELLGINYHDERFPNALHEFVMGKRAAGFKIKEICLELKKNNKPNHRETVRKILRLYESKWNIVIKTK